MIFAMPNPPTRIENPPIIQPALVSTEKRLSRSSATSSVLLRAKLSGTLGAKWREARSTLRMSSFTSSLAWPGLPVTMTLADARLMSTTLRMNCSGTKILSSGELPNIEFPCSLPTPTTLQGKPLILSFLPSASPLGNSWLAIVAPSIHTLCPLSNSSGVKSLPAANTKFKGRSARPGVTPQTSASSIASSRYLTVPLLLSIMPTLAKSLP